MKLRTKLIFLGFGALIWLGSSFDTRASLLDDYQWERRPLLIFSPNGSHPELVSIRDQLSESACEVKDRDMVIGTLIEGHSSDLDGKLLSREEQEGLREELRVAAGQFQLLLIGKDGAEKFRSEASSDLTEIFDLIDGMPMRQQEKLEKHGHCGL